MEIVIALWWHNYRDFHLVGTVPTALIFLILGGVMEKRRISFNMRVTEKTWKFVNKESKKTKEPMSHIFERIVGGHYATLRKKKPATKKKTK